MEQRRISLCHWGPFEATVRDGRLVETRPLAGSGANADMIGAWPEMLYSDRRIDRPHVRKSFLELGPRAGGAGRGAEEMIPVDWDTALDLVAGELTRVHGSHGPRSVFGGSYGWSSAGRLHHARSQVRRFLAAAGGFTDQIGNYSWGAAQAILPHVLGSFDAVARTATSWQTIAAETDLVVAFGGLNPKNWRVTSGGAGAHHMAEAVAKASARGTRFILLSPMADDIPPGLEAELIRPRPNSDTAIMLALAHEAVVTGRADMDFLARFTTGHERLISYLLGETDGTPKTLDWAARIADVPVAELQRLWQAMETGRVMLTAAWSLQRAEHGEQPFWALVALAAVLGQIGLPGGGFCFGYGSMNAVGADARNGYVPSLPGLPNPHGLAIPVASFAEAMLKPGHRISFGGREVTFPDIRMVYWAGGNPFHHAQDLGMVDAAWRRPETIVVHEPWWTPTAARADIVLPATTPLERNDLGGSSRDASVFAMPKLVEPLAEARNDFDIFCALADRLGVRPAFDEGLDESGWLRRLWRQTEARGAEEGISVPGFDPFWQAGVWQVPLPAMPEVLLEEFRADPDAQPLATPSGRIELWSERIHGFGQPDCPPHAAWIAPQEWLGNAEPDELHLITNQPAKQLHSQLWQARQDAGPAPVRLNPADARARGIAEGALVRVHNHRGACRAVAKLDPTLRTGVVVMATGAWYAPDPESGIERNGNPNVLTSDRRSSKLGQACAALSALVRVEPLGATTGIA
ncbi:molybdopterin-dependent oxidoreductase [Tropicimonas sp. IMCC6043]|uniref:molybdopterin-dependent oxidoreductase n=1 Tax=Tropicimonas sp. IMCC6043 TaxID=2510645 RepID=UPI001A92842B|nr:molybdopterin-dependent oxidoreductase [Tropicimonas sp. IMCC6043]